MHARHPTKKTLETTTETVWNELAGDDYYGAAVTATDKGIVIVAPSTNGSFQSFYQPYGPHPWQFDGSLGDKSGPGFSSGLGMRNHTNGNRNRTNSHRSR